MFVNYCQFLIIPLLWVLALIGKKIFEFRQIQRIRHVKDLSTLHRRDFEKYVANKLKKSGRKQVQLRKGTSDGGRDIRAVKNGVSHLIQCKYYKPQVSIGVKTLRELFGVLKSTEQHGIGVICTTGRYNKEAKKIAAKSGIKLWCSGNFNIFL